MRIAEMGRAGLVALALGAWSAPGFAADETHEGTPLTAEAFDALTRGKSMDTSTAGGIYGVEIYLPGQNVIWRDAGRCVRGTWRQVDDNICFLYEDKPGRPVCWTYYDRGDHIEGWYVGEDPVSEPITLRQGNSSVECDGYLGT